MRKFHGRGNVLGASVQLCVLPWLGFVPDDVTAAPAPAVARLADRLGIPAAELSSYGQRYRAAFRSPRTDLRHFLTAASAPGRHQPAGPAGRTS